MRLPLLFAAALASAAGFAQSTCETATPVSAGLHVVDTLQGQLPMPVCAQNGNGETNAGEWYTYTAADDHTITITSSLPQNEGRDTRVHIYTGTCDELFCLAGDDDAGVVYLSITVFVVLEGQTVYIAWDNRWDANGFDWELIEAPYIAPAVSFVATSIEGVGSKLGVVDMNGDYLDDVVAVSNVTGNIFINYQTAEGTFNPVSVGNEAATFYPSWSMTAGDLDNNGYNDLMFGGGSGVSFMFASADGTGFTELSGSEYVFSQRGNMVDIDNDGILDAFMCHDVEPNVYYMSDGNGGLTFFQGGLGDVENGGNYGSVWIDYDLDGDTDLFLAKCRGGNSSAKINELHRNNGDGTFTNVAPEIGLDDPLQTWSSAWGDYDNDGDLDVFIGASTFSDGVHKMLENNGDGTFDDISLSTGLTEISGTGIENICRDFDNDGYLDILGLGGSLMMNNGDWSFTEQDIQFGNGPVGDLNDDGFLDVVNQQVHMNQGNDNNYLVISTQGTMSNSNGVGAMVYVYTPTHNLMRQVISGDGFRYMSSLNVHFGLGEEAQIDSVYVVWPSGLTETYVDVQSNTHFTAVEGAQPTAVSDRKGPEFLIYPNPTRDLIFIDTPQTYSTATYRLFDVSGRLVAGGRLVSNTINVSDVKSGVYVLSVNFDGLTSERKFVKQ